LPRASPPCFPRPDCEYFEQFIQFGGENFEKWTKDGQLSGDGCVYPAYVKTIANQLTAKGLTWKSYDQNMGNDPRRDGTTQTRRGPACGHPRLNHVDLTDITGPKGGLPQANRFLEKWIPRITSSPAYRAGGLIVVTIDESGDDENAGACCGETDSLGFTDPSHPNANEPGLYGPGGGRVGAVLLSPYIRPGTVSKVGYNHYSLLRSVEDLFGLRHLGDAQQPGVVSFGPDVYTRFR
jgi:hypothetical protein